MSTIKGTYSCNAQIGVSTVCISEQAGQRSAHNGYKTTTEDNPRGPLKPILGLSLGHQSIPDLSVPGAHPCAPVQGLGSFSLRLFEFFDASIYIFLLLNMCLQRACGPGRFQLQLSGMGLTPYGHSILRSEVELFSSESWTQSPWLLQQQCGNTTTFSWAGSSQAEDVRAHCTRFPILGACVRLFMPVLGLGCVCLRPFRFWGVPITTQSAVRSVMAKRTFILL